MAYFTATLASSDRLPDGKRVPFGWHTAVIDGESLVLRWPDLPAGVAPTQLRIAVALDTRDTKLVEASVGGRVVGTFDIRFSSAFQLHQIPLAPGDGAALRRQGVALRLLDGSPLHIFSDGDLIPPALMPHLLGADEANALGEFFARLSDGSCLQPFSWLAGCVLDGQLDLAELPAYAPLKEAAWHQLALYLPKGALVYENPRSEPVDGKIYGIEGTLPFAALAQLQPAHPALELALQFWRDNADEQGAVTPHGHSSSEGSYTVGYPLAVIGKQRDDDELQRLALAQLRVRQARLFDGQTFWRTHDSKGKGNRNWARGIAWQLLGMARTLRELNHRSDGEDMIEAFRQLALWARQFQLESGLWSVFVDEPNLTPDTSGSAGIAAALAIGARQGWLEEEARRAAQSTLGALKNHLTADGFLRGAAQSNKGGEALQRADYRVISPMAMGLMAQLIAALEQNVKLSSALTV